MRTALFIVGGNSTALEMREIVDTFYPDKYTAVYNVIGDTEETTINSNVIKDSELENTINNFEQREFILGFSSVKLREKMREVFGSYNAVETNVLHPQSFVSPSAQLGKGVYLGAFAVVSSNAVVGDGCMINISVSVGHDCVLGKDCCINPGARISGHVKIGDNTLVGANSCIFQGMAVGSNCSIDAMTFIERNIEDKQMCTNRMGTLKIYKNRV